MALTLTTATRNAACNAIVDLIDGGSGAGYLEIGTTGMASLLVTNTFSDPAFGNATTGVATASTITDGTAGNTGTAAEARIRDSAATDIITGLTVGTSGSNINLSSVSITATDLVSITAMTGTMPAS